MYEIDPFKFDLHNEVVKAHEKLEKVKKTFESLK